MLFGVAVASLAKNLFLAVLLAYFSHYFLDLFPHVEYNIDDIKNKNWKKSTPAILRVVLDFSLGLLLISIFTDKSLIIFICAFFAMLPDGLSVLNEIFPNKILNVHDYLHLKKIHFLKHNKNISFFWRVITQVVAVIISILILK
jgi:hypothetical protein